MKLISKEKDVVENRKAYFFTAYLGCLVVSVVSVIHSCFLAPTLTFSLLNSISQDLINLFRHIFALQSHAVL